MQKKAVSPTRTRRRTLAKMLRKLGRVPEAMAVIRPVYEATERTGKLDGWIDEEMAECLLAEGQSAEAKPLFGRAYEALKEDDWVKQHEPAKDRAAQAAFPVGEELTAGGSGNVSQAHEACLRGFFVRCGASEEPTEASSVGL